MTPNLWPTDDPSSHVVQFTKTVMFPSQLFHFYSLQRPGAISLLISLKAHFKQCIFSCTSNLSFKEKREKKKTSWAYLSYMTHAEYRGRWKHQICVERWRHCALSCISTRNRHKWHDCITFIHDALFNSRSPFLLQWFDGAHDWRHDATNCLSECAIKNDGGSLWDMKKSMEITPGVLINIHLM